MKTKRFNLQTLTGKLGFMVTYEMETASLPVIISAELVWAERDGELLPVAYRQLAGLNFFPILMPKDQEELKRLIVEQERERSS